MSTVFWGLFVVDDVREEMNDYAFEKSARKEEKTERNRERTNLLFLEFSLSSCDRFMYALQYT